MKACTKSCRFPGGTVERIEEAAGEHDVLESEIFRRAVRHYIRSNPDEIPAFSDADDGVSVAEVDPEQLVTKGPNEEPEETVTEESDEADAEEAEEAAEAEDEGDDDDTNSEGENVLSGDVYDPCEEGM